MSHAREKIVDDFVKLMMGAVGTAQGMQEEAASLMRSLTRVQVLPTTSMVKRMGVRVGALSSR